MLVCVLFNGMFIIAVCLNLGCHLVNVVSIDVLVRHCCSMMAFVVIVNAVDSCLCRADGNASNGQGSVSLNATASKEPRASAWNRQPPLVSDFRIFKLQMWRFPTGHNCVTVRHDVACGLRS